MWHVWVCKTNMFLGLALKGFFKDRRAYRVGFKPIQEDGWYDGHVSFFYIFFHKYLSFFCRSLTLFEPRTSQELPKTSFRFASFSSTSSSSSWQHCFVLLRGKELRLAVFSSGPKCILWLTGDALQNQDVFFFFPVLLWSAALGQLKWRLCGGGVIFLLAGCGQLTY